MLKKKKGLQSRVAQTTGLSKCFFSYPERRILKIKECVREIEINILISLPLTRINDLYICINSTKDIYFSLI